MSGRPTRFASKTGGGTTGPFLGSSGAKGQSAPYPAQKHTPPNNELTRSMHHRETYTYASTGLRVSAGCSGMGAASPYLYLFSISRRFRCPTLTFHQWGVLLRVVVCGVVLVNGVA